MSIEEVRENIKWIAEQTLQTGVCSDMVRALNIIHSVVFTEYFSTKKDMEEIFPCQDLIADFRKIQEEENPSNWHMMMEFLFRKVQNGEYAGKEEEVAPISELRKKLDESVHHYKWAMKCWITHSRPLRNGGIGVSGKKLSIATLKSYESPARSYRDLMLERKKIVKDLALQVGEREKKLKGLIVERGGCSFRILPGKGRSTFRKSHGHVSLVRSQAVGKG